MKVGYFADGPWSHKALHQIVDAGLEIVFIVPRFDTCDPYLKQWADVNDVDFLIEENVNSPQFLEKVHSYGADIFVSMSFNQILRTSIINLPPKGFINCHAGALPFYRGRNPLNWALINDEKSFGITVHYVDEGIDTGDIILQKKIPITDADDYASLLEKAFVDCADVLLEAMLLFRDGKASPQKQSEIHPVGTYLGRRIPGDEYIDWSWPSRRIFNFTRAITLPGPGARTNLQTLQENAILKTELIPDAPEYIATCGEVIGRAEDGVVVKTGDTTIKVTLVAEIAEDGTLSEPVTPKYKIGTRLGLTSGETIKALQALLRQELPNNQKTEDKYINSLFRINDKTLT